MAERILDHSSVRSVSTDRALEFLGAVTGIAGTALLALAIQFAFAAFIMYAISNVAWIAFGLRKELKGLMGMNAAFAVFTALGLINHWPI